MVGHAFGTYENPREFVHTCRQRDPLVRLHGAVTPASAADLNSGTVSAAAFLNLNGTLAYAQGSNQFTGNVTAPGVALHGSATGRFYGPAAQELGGTYRLTPDDPFGNPRATMMGGFGGKRP